MPTTREKASYIAGPLHFNIEDNEPEVPLREYVERLADTYARSMREMVVSELEEDGYDPDKTWSEQ